jgi:hypothetical protein
MDCSKNQRLDMTPHEEFALSHTHPGRSPMLSTFSVMETSGEMQEERRQQHESIQ